jgi:hypothetical protein
VSGGVSVNARSLPNAATNPKTMSAAPTSEMLVMCRDGVESYICGSDVGLAPASYDFAVVGVFTTQADFESYRDHPQHQRIISEQIAPILGDRTVVQLKS